ncbi:MAG: hypothetical protein OXB84_09280 [Halobacteriovoraceae bacterium]|nr:hypothetical protein [Halobacteriovoraceae bacterium]
MFGKKLLSIVAILGAILFLLIDISPSYAKAIEEITSDKAAKKVRKIRPVARDLDEFNYHSVGLGLGQTFLMGDYEHYGLNAITWDLLYSYAASYSYDILTSLHLSSHNRLDKNVELLGLSVGIRAKIFQFDSFAPFMMGGLGFYSPSFESNDLPSASKVVFGTNVALGGELDLGELMKIGVMGQLHNPFDVQQNTGPNIEGSYFKLLLTMLYSFR